MLNCISFKSTQYKEFKFLREIFKNIDSKYYPTNIKIPTAFTFRINFDINLPKKQPPLPPQIKPSDYKLVSRMEMKHFFEKPIQYYVLADYLLKFSA